MNEFYLGIIPARSGSKGLKDKNIRELQGTPLIQYTIEDARESSKLSDFLVSTDSEKYAQIAKDAGAPVPFIRPSELATDEASSLDVVKHAVQEYESTHDVKVHNTVLLQPTTPFRKPEDIDKAIDTFIENDEASLVSCYSSKDIHPNYLYERDGDVRLRALRDQDSIPRRRQEHDPIYHLNGAIYITNWDLIFEMDKLYTNRPLFYEMSQQQSVNIDEPSDWKLAEFLLKEYIEEYHV